MTQQASDIFYRYDDVAYAPCVDEWDNPIPGSETLRVHLRKYTVLKRTPCGVWIDLGFGDKRFVNTKRRKQFACATRDLAKRSFIARKERQASIHMARVRRAEKAIRLVLGEKD